MRDRDLLSPEDRAEPVVVVDYDPAWPATFAVLRDRLATVLGDLAAGIEHIGSTAVPGLAAKPIIDLDVVLRRASDFARAAERLERIGYTHLGDLGIIERAAFRAPPGSPRHHLYVCPAGAPALRAHLALRDTLRAEPALLAAYADLKRSLAAQFRDDRDAYAEGKTAFITAALGERSGQRRARRK
ncbi:MAG TPA: GrpB family protein [Candidatus Sulfotelmatobacter sp.]|nr:GrpB family protein [Candidatus Sulfotelmatobacter sp.]